MSILTFCPDWATPTPETDALQLVLPLQAATFTASNFWANVNAAHWLGLYPKQVASIPLKTLLITAAKNKYSVELFISCLHKIISSFGIKCQLLINSTTVISNAGYSKNSLAIVNGKEIIFCPNGINSSYPTVSTSTKHPSIDTFDEGALFNITDPLQSQVHWHPNNISKSLI